jgi:hypothetical protein
VTDRFDIHSHVHANELLTSSVLIQRCVAAGLNQTHARQLLRRNSSNNGIWRSEKFVMQSNGRLYAHSNFRASEGFVAQLLAILVAERPGLHRLAQKLLANEVVLRRHAEMLLACPIDTEKTRYPSYGAEVAALEEVMGCQVEMRDTVGERLVLRRLGGTLNSSAAGLSALTTFQTEVAITNILIEHLRCQNFISWHPAIKSENPQRLIQFNNYPFFAATFSWLSPMVRWNEKSNKPKPTPVVFHVCLSQCRTWDVEGLAARIERAGANKTSRLHVLGVLAASDFEIDAWNNAKKGAS